MNIIDRDPQGQKSENNTSTFKTNLLYRNIYIGLVLIAMGVLWMLRNLDVVDQSLFNVVFSWQMLLMVIGGYLLTLRKIAAGGIVFAIGAIFAIGSWFDLPLPVQDIILPLVVIVIGVFYLFQRR